MMKPESQPAGNPAPASSKSAFSSALQQRLDRHFVACTATVGATVALAAAGAQDAKASIVYSGTLNLPIPTNNFSGIYVDLDTRTTSTSNVAGTSDLNVFDFTSFTQSSNYQVRGQGVFGPTNASNLILANNSTATGLTLKLAANTTIGPASTTFGRQNYLAYQFLSAGGAAAGARTGNFAAAGAGFIGFSFASASGLVDYGWMRISVSSAATGSTLTVVDYAYENTGAAIAAGATSAVPEPGTCALGCLAAGAVGLTALRRRRQEDPAAPNA